MKNKKVIKKWLGFFVIIVALSTLFAIHHSYATTNDDSCTIPWQNYGFGSMGYPSFQVQVKTDPCYKLTPSDPVFELGVGDTQTFTYKLCNNNGYPDGTKFTFYVPGMTPGKAPYDWVSAPPTGCASFLGIGDCCSYVMTFAPKEGDERRTPESYLYVAYTKKGEGRSQGIPLKRDPFINILVKSLPVSLKVASVPSPSVLVPGKNEAPLAILVDPNSKGAAANNIEVGTFVASSTGVASHFHNYNSCARTARGDTCTLKISVDLEAKEGDKVTANVKASNPGAAVSADLIVGEALVLSSSNLVFDASTTKGQSITVTNNSDLDANLRNLFSSVPKGFAATTNGGCVPIKGETKTCTITFTPDGTQQGGTYSYNLGYSLKDKKTNFPHQGPEYTINVKQKTKIGATVKVGSQSPTPVVDNNIVLTKGSENVITFSVPKQTPALPAWTDRGVTAPDIDGFVPDPSQDGCIGSPPEGTPCTITYEPLSSAKKSLGKVTTTQQIVVKGNLPDDDTKWPVSIAGNLSVTLAPEKSHLMYKALLLKNDDSQDDYTVTFHSPFSKKEYQVCGMSGVSCPSYATPPASAIAKGDQTVPNCTVTTPTTGAEIKVASKSSCYLWYKLDNTQVSDNYTLGSGQDKDSMVLKITGSSAGDGLKKKVKGENAIANYVAVSASYSNSLYLGGDFDKACNGKGPCLETSAEAVAVNKIARWDGQNWHALGTEYVGTTGSVRSLNLFNGDLFIGGSFGGVGSKSVNGIAVWRGDDGGWETDLLDGGVSASGSVYSLLNHNNELYVAGSFTSAGGSDAANVAVWDPTKPKEKSWAEVGDGLGKGDSGSKVNDLVIFNNQICAGGVFSTNKNIACLTDNKWALLGGGLDVSGDGVNTLFAESDSKLYAGGEIGKSNLKFYNGSTWSDLTNKSKSVIFNKPIYKIISSRTSGNGNGFEILIGGGFTDLDVVSPAANYIVGALPPAWFSYCFGGACATGSPQLNGAVYTILYTDTGKALNEYFYAGGDFTGDDKDQTSYNHIVYYNGSKLDGIQTPKGYAGVSGAVRVLMFVPELNVSVAQQ